MFKKLKENAEKLANSAKEKASNVADKVEGCIPEEITDRINDAKISVGESISDLSDKAGNFLDSNLEEIESYCSWCFEKHGCTPKERNNFTRNIYICNGCGKEIVKCRACNNKAKFAGEENTDKDDVGIWSGNFCSVHEGTIAKFETLNWKLSTIGEYRDIVERKDRDYKKIGTTAAYTIGGAAVIAPLALAAAPAVGGALGTSLLGYSGAAATNAGLATLGGGALAAGGAGMAGGVAVVTAAGSALGGRYGAVISNSYYGDIDGFEIIKIKPGTQPAIICIDGFLTEKSKEASGKWLDELTNIYPENEIYYVKWEAKRLRDIASTFSAIGSKEIAKKGVWGLAKSASKTAATKLAPVGYAFQALGLVTNPWSVAGVKAYQVGALLSDIIARTDKEYILIGHSLGARVIYSCLASLKTKDEAFIKDVHLLGGAVNNSCSTDKDTSSCVNWSGIEDSVSGSINNYFSSNDSVLKYLYKAGEGVKFDLGSPIGRHGINNPKINNVDVSIHVSGHSKYKGEIENFITQPNQ
ncbi:hypothetical protein PCIT_b1271 [Pseudoalteromonas citrea]|uniref:DUF726 domain-containing protein n=2 Tax=Pseudoalteromonas citrea TaxID=43655 RepID=A0AAD4FQI0_9GAMM|nr:DUF726 domain-containing protein [Pseudoalteromonas citrea]KAF7765121.1 hypothetical protein PCIT_b1271 [Pseudoalteromonas citrea]